MAPLTKTDFLFAAVATSGDSFGASPPLVKEVIDLCWPIGSIHISTSSTNPGLTFGIGTWSAFGAGRVLVGLDSGDVAFDAVEETGGSKTHTLVEAEIPAHTHVQNAHTHVQNAHTHLQNAHSHVQGVNSATAGGLSGYTPDTSTNTRVDSGYSTANTTAVNQDATAVNQNATAVNQNTGGGGAHNNLQPYITVYMWKRTA
jgi:microcystin-dependent protein